MPSLQIKNKPMASPHPFRTIKEGILNNRPANISDKNYAVLCEAVKDLDEDSYHVDLDEDMQGIAGVYDYLICYQMNMHTITNLSICFRYKNKPSIFRINTGTGMR